MAEITNPQLVTFCNDYLRTIADTLTRIDTELPGVLALYESRNLGTVINEAGSINYITDGSQSDGRTRRVGGDVYNFVTLLQDLKTFLDVSGRRDVLIGWQVNALTE